MKPEEAKQQREARNGCLGFTFLLVLAGTALSLTNLILIGSSTPVERNFIDEEYILEHKQLLEDWNRKPFVDIQAVGEN